MSKERLQYNGEALELVKADIIDRPCQTCYFWGTACHRVDEIYGACTDADVQDGPGHHWEKI